MAQVQTAPAKGNGQAKQERRERGTGPLVITYVGGGKNDLKRVSKEVTGVHVVAKGGSANDFDVTKLSQETLLGLATLAMSSRMKVYTTNNGNPDGSDALECCSQVYSDFLAGKIYSRSADGEKAGKKFDGELYAQALAAAYAAMAKRNMKTKDKVDPESGKVIKAGALIKPLTPEQVLDTKASLEAMEPKARNERIKGWKANKFFDQALDELKLKAKRADQSEVDTEALPF